MKKKKSTKQIIHTTTSVKNKSFAILIPDLQNLNEQQIHQIATSNATNILVVKNGNSQNEKFIDLEEGTAINVIQNLEFDNIVHIGNSDCIQNALIEGKSDINKILFVGEKNEKKEKRGAIGRAFYEFSTQLTTNIKTSGSHTKTAIYPKQVLLDSIEKDGLSSLENFKQFCSRASNRGVGMSQIGYFNNLTPSNTFKEVLNNQGLFFKERLNYFITQPIKDLKSSKSEKGANNSIYRLLFFALFILCMVVLPILSSNYGSTWDEQLHKDYGKDLVEYYTQGSEEIFNEKNRAYFAMKYYGASFDFISAAVHKIFPSVGIYELRHVINTIFGVLCFFFCGLIAREFGGWRAAFIGFLLILFSPSFFGHIFNNPKDIPFAAGYAMGLLYLIRYFKELPNPSIKTSVYLILGIALSISIRPPGIILVAFLVMVIVVHWLFFVEKADKKKYALSYILKFATVAISGYILGIILWPFGLQDPLNNLMVAMKELSNFSLLTYYELYDGVRMYIKPWHYVPKTILFTTPLIVLLGLILGLINFVKFNSTKKKWLLAFMLFVIVFPPAYAIYKESYIYNGWRHFLFIYVPIVAIAATGFDLIIRVVKGYGRYITYGLLTIGLGLVFIWQLKNHPYEYVYHNELIGGVKGAAGDYETDYWCQTPKDAVKWLMKNEIKPGQKVRIKSNNEPFSLQYEIDKFTDSATIVWSREYEWLKGEWDYAIWTSRTLSKNQIEGDYWPPKGTIHTIDVEGFPLAAIVKRDNQHAKNGIALLDQQKFEEAIVELKKAEQYNPLEEEVVRRIGLAYKGLNQFDKAMPYLKKAMKLRDGNYDAMQAIGEINMFKADFLGREGKVEEAKKFANQAKAYFMETIKHKINYTTAYYYLGNLYLNEGNYTAAITEYDKLIAKNPNVAQGYYMKARAQVAINDFKNAIESLNYAIGINKGFKEAYYLMAECYKKQGNENAAKQVLAQMPK